MYISGKFCMFRKLCKKKYTSSSLHQALWRDETNMAKVLRSLTWSSYLAVRLQISSKTVFSISDKSCKRYGMCCASFGTFSQHMQRRKRIQDQSNTEFMEEEIKKYEIGKRWLAKMMGADVETFTDSDVEESLHYLLPTKLFASDARPMMKHPTELFPESKSSFSSDGRPAHPAFYTGAQAFHDLIYDISRYGRMAHEMADSITMEDTVQRANAVEKGKSGNIKFRWLNQKELEAVLGEQLTQKNYEVVIHRLKKLAGKNTQSNLDQIKEFLEKFQTSRKQEGSQFNIQELDEDGKAHGKGYRKRAMAEVWISNGTGKIVVNDTPLIEYFCKYEDRNQVWHPFIQLDCMGKFDVECNVIGGGTTGQAGAIRLAISRALTSISTDFMEPLQKAGLLTRDSRLVERKKPGQKKARKKFAWVKR